MNDFYYARTLSLSMEQAEARAREELQAEGFGVLTEIDVKETFKNKLDIAYKPYKILGACNPPAAFEALRAEPLIGTMLPCNVVIREIEDDQVQIAAVDPVASMASVENEHLGTIAADIRDRLRAVVDRV